MWIQQHQLSILNVSIFQQNTEIMTWIYLMFKEQILEVSVFT